MCNISGGGIGGILGSIGGTLLSAAFPEIGIPLALASGLGGFAGTTIGDVASGKSIGSSLEEGAISGALSGALAGAGNLATGGSFFGPASSSISGLFGGGAAAADAATGATTAATQGVAPTLTAAASPALSTAGTGASAAGAGAGSLGGDVGTIVGSTGGAGSGTAANLGSAIGASSAPLSGGGVSPWGSDFAKGIWSGGMTGGDVGGAGPLVTGDSGPLTSYMAPLDSSVAPLTRGTDLSLNLTTPGVQTASLPTAGSVTPTATGAPTPLTTTALTQPAGYSGLTADQIAQVNNQGFYMRPDAVTPYAAGTAGAPSVPGTGGGGLWSFLTKGGSSPLSKGLIGEPGSILGDLTKPSSLITGGAALLPLLQGNTIPGLSALQNQATAYNAAGAPLAQALNTGNLPAGAQSSLDAATRAGTAAVRSRFAQMGLSGSSQEADALAGVQENAAAEKVKMLGNVTQIGLQEMARADPLLQTIMTTRLQQDQQQQQAIARLAAALAGSTGTEKTTA